MIYKIATAESYAAGRTATDYPGMQIDLADGFVHFSTAEQLLETLRLYFRGQGDLLLLAVRTGDLGTGLRWERSRGGQLFPHLYAPLPLTAIAWSAPLAVAEDGTCILPEAVR